MKLLYRLMVVDEDNDNEFVGSVFAYDEREVLAQTRKLDHAIEMYKGRLQAEAELAEIKDEMSENHDCKLFNDPDGHCDNPIHQEK